MKKGVHLGFEVGTGKPVDLPIRHMAITGQTQEAGKTTTLEALIARSQLRAVTFVTKRGEGSFTNARRIAPYFREQTDWQFVASILEASRGEKLKFERAWIIRASKGARTLADVHHNVRVAMEKAKGLSADVYLTLDAYLDQGRLALDLQRMEERAQRAEARARNAEEQTGAAADLGRALARLLPAGAGSVEAVDLARLSDAIVERVLARIPAGGAGPITVTPPEKLRKDFQQDESMRIVALAKALKPLQKRVLKLLETTGGEFVGQPTINQRLGRSVSGGSMSDMGTAVNDLASLGLVEVKPRAGVAKRLRQKIAEDLAFYKATEQEVEAVYQSVLFVLATEGEAAA